MPHKKMCPGCSEELLYPTDQEKRISFAHHDYAIGEKLYYQGKAVLVERIELPTTVGSNAWLMTRYEGIPRFDEDGRENGGTVGAPDTSFSRSPV